MINLMPPELKTGYTYARRNVALRMWVVMFLVALVGLGALATYGMLTMKQSSKHYDNVIAQSQTVFKKEESIQTQKQVLDISNNFKLAVKVLSQEVLFSQLIKQIGATIPDGANLTGLTINQTKGGIDIVANATDYKTATQVQVNLENPKNKIFSKADIVNVSCGGGTDTSSNTNAAYPCTVNIRALFANNNPFLFVNSKEVQP